MKKTGTSMARWCSAVPLTVAALMAAACSSTGSATAAHTSTNPVRASTAPSRTGAAGTSLPRRPVLPL